MIETTTYRHCMDKTAFDKLFDKLAGRQPTQRELNEHAAFVDDVGHRIMQQHNFRSRRPLIEDDLVGMLARTFSTILRLHCGDERVNQATLCRLLPDGDAVEMELLREVADVQVLMARAWLGLGLGAAEVLLETDSLARCARQLWSKALRLASETRYFAKQCSCAEVAKLVRDFEAAGVSKAQFATMTSSPLAFMSIAIGHEVFSGRSEVDHDPEE